MLEAPAGFGCFWSHGASRRAGIWLLARNSWLAQFSKIHWAEIIPGTAGRLACRGPCGSVDFYSLYLHTGNPDTSCDGSMADLPHHPPLGDRCGLFCTSRPPLSA
jgi:hypothetical protein